MVWQQAEKQNWYNQQIIKRSYLNEVVTEILSLQSSFEVKKYGALAEDKNKYPLYLTQSKKMDLSKKTILITGGVHGYETSGVHGALSFLKTKALGYEKHFNFVCAPCISPWSYETINRWNSKAIDSNRSFYKNSPAEECELFLNAMADHNVWAHFDLHETTDTDNTVFRPALEQRDGIHIEFSEIPDGFYLVGDTENPQKEFQKAIIDSVRQVTHIALPDHQGKLLGDSVQQEGVINYPVKKLFLCAGAFESAYCTTTEVYPDSPKVNDQICVQAQVAAIVGGLEYLINRN